MSYPTSIGQYILSGLYSPFQFMANLLRTDQELNEIQERYIWDKTHLSQVAYLKAYNFCLCDIYFAYSEEPHLLATESESQIISLMNQRTSAKVQKIFEEVFECMRGMFAADIKALHITSFLNLKLAPPIYCERPVADNDTIKAVMLYEKLAKMKPVMAEIEEFHIKALRIFKERKIDVLPVSELVYRVVARKMNEIYRQEEMKFIDKSNTKPLEIPT